MKAKLIAIVASLALATPVLAQGGPGPRGSAARAQNFDPATVTTVTGEVTAVHKIEGRRNGGVHVDLKAADATYDVHLGPSSFLTKQGVQVKSGDKLEVTGSKVQLGGKPALIAQSVKKGDSTLTLRDARGIPAWSRRAAR